MMGQILIVSYVSLILIEDLFNEIPIIFLPIIRLGKKRIVKHMGETAIRRIEHASLITRESY